MSAKKESFVFEANGKKLVIPDFKSLPTGALRKARKAKDDMDKAFLILEYVLGEDSPEIAVLDSFTVDEFSDFVGQWTGGASVGESSDS